MYRRKAPIILYMRKVSVDTLKPGMKVAKPVVNDSGMILFGAGTALTDSLIERLGNMNVGAVYVEGEAQRQKSKEELLAALDARFSKTGHEPHMAALKQLFKERIEGMAP